MTEREKLVELINHVCEHHIENLLQPGGAETLADHLIANGVTVQNWRDAKTDPPKSGEHVLLCCEVRRSDGSSVKRYVCDGFYAAKHTETVFYDGDDIACEYSEENDKFYLLEGWYEVIRNWGDYNSIVVSDFVVGWMPLPEPLKEE
jgi:hypothetical protein